MINASGTVTFEDTVTLYEGADLIVEGASDVVLLGGIRFVGADATESSMVLRSASDTDSLVFESLLGLWARETATGLSLDSNAFTIGGLQYFELTGNAQSTGVGTIQLNARSLDVGFPDGVSDGSISAETIMISVTESDLDLSLDLNATDVSIDVAGSIGARGSALDVNADRVVVHAGGDAYLGSSSQDLVLSSVVVGGTFGIASTGNVTSDGSIQADMVVVGADGNVALDLDASGIEVTGGQEVQLTSSASSVDLISVDAVNFSLETDGSITQSGNILITGSLDLTADEIVLSQDTNQISGTLQLAARTATVSTLSDVTVSGVLSESLTVEATGDNVVLGNLAFGTASIDALGNLGGY